MPGMVRSSCTKSMLSCSGFGGEAWRGAAKSAHWTPNADASDLRLLARIDEAATTLSAEDRDVWEVALVRMDDPEGRNSGAAALRLAGAVRRCRGSSPSASAPLCSDCMSTRPMRPAKLATLLLLLSGLLGAGATAGAFSSACTARPGREVCEERPPRDCASRASFWESRSASAFGCAAGSSGCAAPCCAVLCCAVLSGTAGDGDRPAEVRCAVTVASSATAPSWSGSSSRSSCSKLDWVPGNSDRKHPCRRLRSSWCPSTSCSACRDKCIQVYGSHRDVQKHNTKKGL